MFLVKKKCLLLDYKNKKMDVPFAFVLLYPCDGLHEKCDQCICRKCVDLQYLVQ